MAGFLGAANIFDAEVVETTAGRAACAVLGTTLTAAVDDVPARGAAAVVIRPERIDIQTRGAPVGPERNCIEGTVKHVVYLGNCTQIHVDVGVPADLVVEVPNRSGPESVAHRPGDRVNCVCTHDAVRVLARSAAKPVVELSSA